MICQLDIVKAVMVHNIETIVHKRVEGTLNKHLGPDMHVSDLAVTWCPVE